MKPAPRPPPGPRDLSTVLQLRAHNPAGAKPETHVLLPEERKRDLGLPRDHPVRQRERPETLARRPPGQHPRGQLAPILRLRLLPLHAHPPRRAQRHEIAGVLDLALRRDLPDFRPVPTRHDHPTLAARIDRHEAAFHLTAIPDGSEFRLMNPQSHRLAFFARAHRLAPADAGSGKPQERAHNSEQRPITHCHRGPGRRHVIPSNPPVSRTPAMQSSFSRLLPRRIPVPVKSTISRLARDSRSFRPA